ncbi:MAG: carbonate dehydratase [Taibaiella sp.]|nr:carbonate dehydratase [Taibaiella sp.]
MSDLHFQLLENNKEWVANNIKRDPDYYKNLAKGQTPEYLWIGCSDSRVPANEVTGTKPGEMFVHRNIANMVIHNDLNLLSVLSYAVEVLKVKHVIVCGHYGCGGVLAAMGNKQYGLIDNWLRNIKDVYKTYAEELDNIEDTHERGRRLVELNVIEQINDLSKTSIVQNAWKNGQSLQIHGWVYDINDGILRDLGVSFSDMSALQSVYQFEKA